MKRFFMFMAVSLMMGCTALAQADKIVGTYNVEHEGSKSKIRFYKLDNGKYRAQVAWVSNPRSADGKVRTDFRNPEKSKRSVPVDKIVVIESITYNKADNNWTDGKIYDPTSGKSYHVTISFKDDKTLKLRGYIGVEALGRTVYWQKQ